MVSHMGYQIISIIVPLALASLASIAVLIAGGILKPNKVVRIIVPFAKKKVDDNDQITVFGYKLKDREIAILFVTVLLVIFLATYIFASSFTDISFKYNPYDTFDCFFANNDSFVQVTPEEALILEDKVVCFTVNFNIGKSMGQATGTLAFSWIFSAIMTWISIKLREKREATDQNNQEIPTEEETEPAEGQTEQGGTRRAVKKKKWNTCCCLSLMLCYSFACSVSVGLIAGGICLGMFKYTTLISTVEIVTCGLILGLQLLLFTVSDIVLCFKYLRLRRKKPEDKENLNDPV
uniref:Uncharacterized protein n=1 Tax=Amphimedon queenslandica TaxID=400682 RepID=A0A1X7UFF5_AMPQE